jgi:GH35 family endo-1,4-beta-xylanase
LNILAEVGRPIWLTEVDILDKNPVTRADSLEALMRVAFSHPGVHGVILWAFWDNNSWRGPDVALVNGGDWKVITIEPIDL